MKLLLLCLAFLAVAFAFDSDDCKVEREWAAYKTDLRQGDDALWEDQQLYAWGMDGDNKWNDFWHFRDNSGVETMSHYDRTTCMSTAQVPNYEQALPDYVQACGECSLTDATCNCYPYYDIAGSYQISAAPEANGSEEDPTAPTGWPENYLQGNPTFEPIDDDLDGVDFTRENCRQRPPAFVYYYTYRLKIASSGKFYKSLGISKAFKPTHDAWEQWCDDVITDPDFCYVPSSVGSREYSDIHGRHYQYQSGMWRRNEDLDIQFYHNRFEAGCHFKAREHRYPTASYCGDDAGWKYGSGTTAHVRFGCDVSTFQDTDTDGFDIDDSDCESVYLQFDSVSPLSLTTHDYTPDSANEFAYNKVSFAKDYSPINGVVGQCWYKSEFKDHRRGFPSYRTPCEDSAGVLAVPFLALVSTIMMVVRNLF